jgi:integrase
MATCNPIPLRAFREYLAKIYASGGKAPKTIQQLDHAIRLLEGAGVATTAGITTLAVAEVILRRGAGANANTTRGLLLRLRRVCHLAVRAKGLDPSDLPDWDSLRPRATRPIRNRPHAPEEVARLLSQTAAGPGWFGGRLHALASLVAYTGLRRNEALLARVEDLDLDEGFVFVSPRARLKTSASAAPVPLPDRLVPTLREWVPRCGGTWLFPGARREGPWVGGSPGYRPLDRLRAAGEAAGIAAVGFHSLRHTLGTQLLRCGAPTWAIQRVLRHTTPMMTEHYLHPTDRDVAAHVRGFAYPDGPISRPGAGAAGPIPGTRAGL